MMRTIFEIINAVSTLTIIISIILIIKKITDAKSKGVTLSFQGKELRKNIIILFSSVIVANISLVYLGFIA